VYDLLAEVTEDTSRSQIPRPNTSAQLAHPLLLTRKALAVKPSPASDALDESGPGSAGKYVAGLRYFRVTGAAQAKALVKLGQLHRRVFGTLANSQSSRSHGMVTIKILRGHRGDRNVSMVQILEIQCCSSTFAGPKLSANIAVNPRGSSRIGANQAYADNWRSSKGGRKHQQVSHGPWAMHGGRLTMLLSSTTPHHP
jgi:hypothetical protein